MNIFDFMQNVANVFYCFDYWENYSLRCRGAQISISEERLKEIEDGGLWGLGEVEEMATELLAARKKIEAIESGLESLDDLVRDLERDDNKEITRDESAKAISAFLKAYRSLE